jgi:hypothetical protein
MARPLLRCNGTEDAGETNDLDKSAWSLSNVSQTNTPRGRQLCMSGSSRPYQRVSVLAMPCLEDGDWLLSSPLPDGSTFCAPYPDVETKLPLSPLQCWSRR